MKNNTISKKEFFSPISAWKFLLKKPVTIKVPYVKREAAERYRGFHINDWNECIGCGTCSKICPTDAIKMVEIEDLPQQYGEKPQRPVIDYGRCSFCAMCVDICTTGSLKMTREYVHISPNPEDFIFAPTEGGIHGVKDVPVGWTRDDDSDLLELERVEMGMIEGEERSKSFIEYVKGYSKEQAMHEASRCVECGICTDRCPQHMQIPEYIKAIWKDDLKDALRWLLKGDESNNMVGANPFSAVCGRVCTHKCEEACSLGNRGEAIAIRWLKRYIVDNVPDYEKVLEVNTVKKDKKVAIVGSGPAGLSAAYFLATLGYEVEVFESLSKPGGVMRYGIPSYRLPDEALDKDIAFIQALGVKIHVGVSVGKDISLEKLREKYDAVFVSTGFTLGRSTKVPGTEHEDVIQALPLLREIRDYLRGEGPKPKIPRSLVVIGGGNVAMDVARSMARLQKMEYGKVDVKITSLERTYEEMPADMEEIEEGSEEGVAFYPGWGPMKIVIENDKVKGVELKKCLEVFDENGRFNPRFDESNKMVLDADMVVEAIGQAPDYDYLPEEVKSKIEFVRGRLLTNEYRQTSVEWLFAGGDIVHGPDIIHAVADGYWAARGIDKFLSKGGK
ncbi:oxidoreductase [Thermosipho melanesiensis]|uniref:4Fe-4S ferredoxin, iron-sulfur binding domain protein n=2 Tax=Thermosipho melanesiensis TaxID=46541 RepID=A6LMC5_THEM4|nr:FAD-dependent oxidoreductase [Thermosipho melanesiensis]ABR31076.1 4Fe-4S ferredoxin, iron-sulfur binding domain protein [Thermosipho melanesiensis BI429]APT74170.1 oxidoreductase [Thermosipho melanesiensis]OOC36115.1 oxidoreductase [Thermosipho melanesiensis]OOC36932.1 oxidoreductase [Thermosipho melanesiensis]OOC37683.1 oxidoreductase [Thermosipho melanesiensis]